MPRDLFGDVSDPSVRVGSRKWYTVPLSLLAHSIVLLLVVVIPLVATAALPDPRSTLPNFVPLVEPILPPPPPVRRVQATCRREPIPTLRRSRRQPRLRRNRSTPASRMTAASPTCSQAVLPGGNRRARAATTASASPGEAAGAGTGRRQHSRAGTIRIVAPVYPPLAQAARVQGMVIIEATSASTGA